MIDPSPDSENVATILAGANLNRIRGRWDAAIESCMDALCHEPHNVAAHSLLGDIYADQGKLDDAIQWYCAALDLQPDSLADRAKLMRAVEDRKRELSESPRKISGAIENMTTAFAVKSANRLLGSQRTVRAAIFIAALLMLSAIVAAPLVIQYRKQSAQGFSYKNANPSQVIEAPPVILGQLPANGSTDSSPTIPMQSGAEVLPADPFDRTLLTHLRANPDLLSHGIEAVAVESDPRTARVVLTFVSSPLSGAPTAVRGALVRNALRLAQSAYRDAQPNPINVFTVRALYVAPPPPAGGSGAGASPISAEPRLSFMGDVTATDLAGVKIDAAGASDSDMENHFTDTWWASSLP